MAKSSLTVAHGITPEVMQKLNQFYNSKDLRGVQTKLTNTAREIRKLSDGRWKMGSGVLGGLSEHLTPEQCQLLQDAAHLIDSVNTHVEHAKEKRVRSEKESKRRQEARLARAKQLVASTYPLPNESNEQQLDVIKTALILNRARQYHTVRNATEFNLYVRNELKEPARLYGRTPTQYRINNLTSIRYDVTRTRRAPQDWLHLLAQTCARAFDCQHLAYYNPLQGWSFKFLGKGISPELAAHAYSALLHQLVAARREHVARQKRCQLKTKRRRGVLFAEGWINAVSYKVTEFAGSMDSETSKAINLCVCFKDGNKSHISLGNLELLTRAERMRRNTIHRYPEELKSAIRAIGKLKRTIREAEHEKQD